MATLYQPIMDILGFIRKFSTIIFGKYNYSSFVFLYILIMVEDICSANLSPTVGAYYRLGTQVGLSLGCNNVVRILKAD